MTTAKKLGFVQEPSRLCPAARRKAEFVVLSGREQKLALCKEPTVFRSLLAQSPPSKKKCPEQKRCQGAGAMSNLVLRDIPRLS